MNHQIKNTNQRNVTVRLLLLLCFFRIQFGAQVYEFLSYLRYHDRVAMLLSNTYFSHCNCNRTCLFLCSRTVSFEKVIVRFFGCTFVHLYRRLIVHKNTALNVFYIAGSSRSEVFDTVVMFFL